ncbi:MAG: hypothetical protein D3922_10705, partial [Candidatus Electrothrix sp. AR1]|nr:hypothetical protein [Candidatus Electrothrix sp. AR1]
MIVQVKVAGRVFSQTLEPLADQQASFNWNGLDYLERKVTGVVNVSVAVGFVYDAVYLAGGNFSRAFAQAGGEVTGIRARREVVSWKRFHWWVSSEKGTGAVAEGWSLSSHHVLESSPHLNKGDGSLLKNNSRIITTVAGNGSQGFSGDNGSALEASFRRPVEVVVDQFGNFFICDISSHRIRKVDTNGIVTTVAGNGSQGFSGDNGPAVDASLNLPARLALDQAGNIFISDHKNHRIRKVDTNGIITTVAGSGVRGFSGDNGPAVQARFQNPTGVAVDQSGNIFIADNSNQRIRKVDTNGIITTVAGNGGHGFFGDYGPA